MSRQTISRGGKTYVLVEQGEYERLRGARAKLPPLPAPDPAGNTDAVAFARATIARNIITRRRARGMSQTELAKAAGVRVETLNRLENAKHTADVSTLAKIDAVLSGTKRPARSARAKRTAKR
jgi:DNA-binding XRE family transcriptional regulator